ncbi:MAG: GumC family protein [Syntrophobacteraceae bacterium]
MNPQVDKPEGAEGSQYPAPISSSNLPATEYRESVPDFEDSADIRDYLEVVLRRKWLVLTFLVGVFITTLVMSLSMKPVYKAAGRLELSVRAPKVTKFQDVDAVTNQLQTREFIQTHVKLLQSESLARRVIEKLHLEQTQVFNPDFVQEKGPDEEVGLFQQWKDSVLELLGSAKETVKEILPFGSGEALDPGLDHLKLQKKMEDQFAKNLTVQPERDTSLISLAFSSTDARLARDIINALIQEFIDWQVDKKIDAAGSAKRQLEKQIDLARVQLEKAENNLNSFAQKAGIVSLDSNLNLIYKQLQETNSALSAAQTDRISKEALYKQFQKGDTSSIPMVVSNQLIQNLREEYVKAMGEVEELSVTFKPDYPKLKNAKAKMLDIEKRIASEESRIFDSLRVEYLATKKREEALKADADAKKAFAMDLNDRATQYKILDREVETSKMIHQSLLERAKEIDANVGTELGNIQVVDAATLPLKPYKPNLRLNLLLSIVVGLMGGVGLAFFIEYLDNTVKRIDEISDRFHIPVLGVLPVAEPDEIPELDFLVRQRPRSSFSESVRTAKVSIQLSSFTDQPPKTILLTSTNAGEGKSTISCNLAQAFCSTEEKVVIIDADLRKPRLHKVFKSNGFGTKPKGLSQVLSGMCGVKDAIRDTDVPSLSFISSGPIPPNPAELLASSRMRNVLDELLEDFDRVIIDAPPAAGFADVLVLGNYVDGVILVSTLGQTHREALRMFRRSILNVRGNLMGTIINKLNIGNHYGGYYYKYYKYYHSYYHPAYKDNKPENLLEESSLEKDV